MSGYRVHRTPPTLGRALSLCPGNGGRDERADRQAALARHLSALSVYSMSPPTNPCTPERSCCNTGGESPPELFTFTIQDARHDAHPAILHSLHSVAHEPDEEPNRLQCGGSHRREYDCHHSSLDNGHAHIDDVPGHHRHVAARHIIRLMLHCSPRFRICWGLGVIVSPCMHGQFCPWRCLPGCFRLLGDMMFMAQGHRCFLLFAD